MANAVLSVLILCGASLTNIHQAISLGVVLECAHSWPFVAREVHPRVAFVAADPIGGQCFCPATKKACV